MLEKSQVKREGGQILILPSEKTEEVGALSDPTNDLSANGKDNTKNTEKQGKHKYIK